MNLKPNVVKGSAMRFSLTLISIAVSIAVLGLIFHIVIQTINKLPIQWSAIGVFVGGLAALLTGSGWNKTKQKEIEIQEHEKE